jgi:hypothetical protein
VTQDGEKVVTEVAQKQLCYFPITPRLNRLFISKRTARHMRRHKEGIHENDGVMGHPSYGEAWKVIDRFDADFPSDVGNVHFRVATDGFDPFSTNSALYSCWLVFSVSYNLPPSLCMNLSSCSFVSLYQFRKLLVHEYPGHQRQVNAILGNLVRMHYPGEVTRSDGTNSPATC